MRSAPTSHAQPSDTGVFFGFVKNPRVAGSGASVQSREPADPALTRKTTSLTKKASSSAVPEDLRLKCMECKKAHGSTDYLSRGLQTRHNDTHAFWELRLFSCRRIQHASKEMATKGRSAAFASGAGTRNNGDKRSSTKNGRSSAGLASRRPWGPRQFFECRGAFEFASRDF